MEKFSKTETISFSFFIDPLKKAIKNIQIKEHDVWLVINPNSHTILCVCIVLCAIQSL